MEPKRTRSALEHDLAVAVDQVETIRPAGILPLDGIVDAVDQRRELNPQLSDATLGNIEPLSIGLRIAIDDAVADVGAHLPDIAGVRLLDVHGEKRRPI